jgi:hypothetical protein
MNKDFIQQIREQGYRFTPDLIARLAADKGIVLNGYEGWIDPEFARNDALAFDAQPALATTANGGIPAFLTTYIDPEVIRVLFSPNKAALIFGEEKKGDWTLQTAMFPMTESTGEVTSYGDFNENGRTGVNVNWPQRQSYLFQTMTQWGQLEMDRAAEARINYANELNQGSALILDKFMNNSYFYGVQGLQNYGALNDPSLATPITPSTKVAGGTTWAVATSAEFFTDIESLYAQLVSQTNGLVDRETKMVLALTPTAEANFTKTNQYNVNVSDQIKKDFPNLRVETAVQYATASGGLVQLFAESLEGQRTAYCAFNEKMRTHAIVVQSSSWKQKKTAGTWGFILRRPFALAQMLGV